MENVKFDLFPGEVHALVGENGAGKSTLLRAACGQIPLSGGRVEVNGDHGKPHRKVRPGDTIRIKIPGGRRRIIEVVELESTSVPKARARELYIDHTPPPTPEEIEQAIVDGLAWLAGMQLPDGSFGYSIDDCDRVAYTALAVLKFETRAIELGLIEPLPGLLLGRGMPKD